GDPTFFVNGCDDGKMRAHIFYQGMCINRWDELLADAGLKALPDDARWTDLKPGCVMTTSDHSISFVMQSDLWCYYYEATTPFGPPLLRVESCPLLYDKFERRYCPSEPLAFKLKAGG